MPIHYLHSQCVFRQIPECIDDCLSSKKGLKILNAFCRKRKAPQGHCRRFSLDMDLLATWVYCTASINQFRTALQHSLEIALYKPPNGGGVPVIKSFVN